MSYTNYRHDQEGYDGYGQQPYSSPDYRNRSNQHPHRVERRAEDYNHGDGQPSQPETPTPPPTREPWGLQNGYSSPLGASPNMLSVPGTLPPPNSYYNSSQNWQTPLSSPSMESAWYQQTHYVQNAYQSSPESPLRNHAARRHQSHHSQGGAMLRPREYFTPGRVFVLRWSQQAGYAATRNAPKSTISGQSELIPDGHGQYIHCSQRRMVVIATSPGHNSSTCVGIYTYGKRGLAKQGLDLNLHAVAHDERRMPYTREDEPPLRRQPLAITVLSPGQKIDKMSRINFSKFHTVEHNVEVRDIGVISDSSMANFYAYLNDARAMLGPTGPGSMY